MYELRATRKQASQCTEQYIGDAMFIRRKQPDAERAEELRELEELMDLQSKCNSSSTTKLK